MNDHDHPQRHPLDWPPGFPRTPVSARSSSARFRNITVAKALQTVLEQLRLMGIDHQDVVISSNVPTRLDGLPYSNRRMTGEDPGVGLYWRDYDGLPISMACDRYDSVEGNLRGLALTLDALRAIERHGSSDLMRRAFQGFKALPAAIPMSAPWHTTMNFDDVPKDYAEVKSRYRELITKHHPDREDDADTNLVVELNAAHDAAKRYYGV